MRSEYKAKCSANFFIESQVLQSSKIDQKLFAEENIEFNDFQNPKYILDDFYMDEIFVDLPSILKMLAIDRKFSEALEFSTKFSELKNKKQEILLIQQNFRIFAGDVIYSYLLFN